MGARNKLLITDSSGRPMVSRVVGAALGSLACEVVVVTGHQAEAVERAVLQAAAGSARLRLVRAPDFAAGLSASLKTGIAAIDGAAAAMVCLGDMPLVTSAMMDALIRAYDPAGGKAIVVPTCRGVRGNPVVWGFRFFPEFASLAGDTGARALLAAHAADIAEVELGSEAVLRDFDTPEAFGAAGAPLSF